VKEMSKKLIFFIIIFLLLAMIVLNIITIITIEDKIATAKSTAKSVVTLEPKVKPKLEEINKFLKAIPPGWTAEEMKAKLEAKFGEKIAVKIIEKDEGVKFVILTIPGETREWWCTYKGLKPWGDK
jgi:uncharacterized FlaG/YvyC family protein